jgi:hypothetical protein
LAHKSDIDLALEEKLDLARVLIRFKRRRQAARELNDIEAAIKARHDAEVSAGNVTSLDIDNIGVGNLTKELPSGATDSN